MATLSLVLNGNFQMVFFIRSLSVFRCWFYWTELPQLLRLIKALKAMANQTKSKLKELDYKLIISYLPIFVKLDTRYISKSPEHFRVRDLTIYGVTTGNRTLITGTTTRSNNHYTIATIIVFS